MDNRELKNLVLFGSLSFSVAFGLGIAVERNIIKSATIGGIATISTVGSTLVLNKKNKRELKAIQSASENLKSIESKVLTLENKNQELLQLIESKTESKNVIENKHNTISREVNTLKQEIISLHNERDNLQKLIRENKAKNQELLQLIEEKNQSKLVIEQEYNIISSEVNTLKQEIISLHNESNNIQGLITNLKTEERKLHLLIKNQTQLKAAIEDEYNLIIAKIRENQATNFIEIDSFIEKDNSYSQELADIPKDFLSIYHCNIDVFRSKVPRDKWGFYWSKLKHGLNILSDEEQLFTYFALYGGMHYYKILYLLDRFFSSEIMQSKSNIHIEIIDYGCGQALATICLLDYLKQKTLHGIIIDTITLIEPSKICLDRGILHINHLRSEPYYPHIKLVNKKLQELNTSDLSTSSKNIKLHLFSNILDFLDFDIYTLANTIKESQSGINYFLCVSPTDLQNRIEKFFSFWCQNECLTEQIQLSSEYLYQKIWKFKSNKFQNDKIHRVQKLFYVHL